MSPDLTFDWKNYIDYAEEIFNDGDLGTDNEYLVRTGISRAYYGLYNLCKQFAVEAGLLTESQLKDSGNSHSRLINELKHTNRFDLEYNKQLNYIKMDIGKTLFKLRDYRNDADYTSKYPRTAEREPVRDLEVAIFDTKEALNNLEKLISGMDAN
ncbi:MAG: hypothetical protein ABR547_09365 [Halanaerobium sp.]